MDWTAPHLGFVVGAYAASLIVLVGLALWLLRRDRSARRALKDAESRRERRQ